MIKYYYLIATFQYVDVRGPFESAEKRDRAIQNDTDKNASTDLFRLDKNGNDEIDVTGSRRPLVLGGIK